MDILFKTVAGVLIAVVLIHAIPGDRKELALLLSITVSCMVGITAFSYLRPVLDFIFRIQEVGQLNSNMLAILTKSVGIGLITEISVLICKDFGNGSLGKSLQFLAISITLWLALPIFDELLDLLESILVTQ